MKGRVWILFFIAFVLLGIGGYAAFFRFIPQHQRLNELIMRRLERELGGSVRISSFTVSHRAFGLNGVSVKFKNAPFTFEADKIQVVFRFSKLLRDGFRVSSAPDELLLTKPRLIWTPSDSDTSMTSLHLDRFPALPVRKIPGLLIRIDDGSFWILKSGVRLAVAEKIGGRFDARDGGSGTLNFRARVFSRKMNASCAGVFSKIENSAEADLNIDSCDLSTDKMDIITGSILLKEGAAGVKLRLVQRGGALSFTGAYRVERGAFTVKDSDIRLGTVNIEGRVNDRGIEFDSASAVYNGITTRLTGSLSFFPEPALTVTARADSADVGEIDAVLRRDAAERPRGQLRFEAEAAGPLRKPVIRASCSSRMLSYGGRTIGDIRAAARIERGSLFLDELRGTIDGNRVLAAGSFSGLGRKGPRDFSFSASLLSVSDRTRAWSVRATGKADVSRRTVSANYSFSDAKAMNSPFSRFEGTLFLEKDVLAFTSGNTAAAFDGQVTDMFSRPSLDARVRLTRFPVHSAAGFTTPEVFIDGSGMVSGNRGRGECSGTFAIDAGADLSAKVSGKAMVTEPFARSRTLALDAEVADLRVKSGKPMALSVSLRADSSAVTVAADERKGSLKLAARSALSTGTLAGTLTLSDFPLEYIIGIFMNAEGYVGKMNGSALIGGTVKAPEFSCPEPIRASDLTLAGINGFSGAARVSGKPGELRFSDVLLRRKDVSIVSADGVWTRGNPFVLRAEGKDAELAAVGDIISPGRRCDGAVDYRAVMTFTRESGTVEGDFTLRNGHFLDVPFDTAAGAFGGGSEGFRATDFRVEKKDVYSGTGAASSGYFWKDTASDPGLKLALDISGKLPRAIPFLTTAVLKADGDARLRVTLGGTWQEPVIVDGSLDVRRAVVEPSFLVEKVSDITASIVIDPALAAPSGLRAVRVASASGTVKNRRLTIANIFPSDREWAGFKRPGLTDVVNELIGLDFGVFIGKIESLKNRDRSVELHIPGFMQVRDTGRFELADENGYFFVGASLYDDKLTPYLGGRIRVLSGDVHYPLLPVPGAPPSAAENAVLEETSSRSSIAEMFWDLDISAGSSVYYVNEVTKTLREADYTIPFFNVRLPNAGATIARTQAKIDENSTFGVHGRIADGTFRVTGSAKSSSGTVSYVGVEFDIEAAELELDTARMEKPASLTARAKTSVMDDSTGVETVIYIKVNAVDTATGKRRSASGRADAPSDSYTELSSELSMVIDAVALGYLQIEFSSSNPADTTRDRVLARLGLSPSRFGSAASRAIAFGMDSYYLNLMRPFEQAIRKYTGLDVVRFTPSVIGNLVRSKLVFLDRFDPDSDYMLFDGTRMMLGEYFLEDFFLSYRGQYGVGRDFLSRRERGFYHEIGLQYLIKRDTRLQLNYNYDEVIKQGDKRIEIRHDFQF